VLLNLCARGQGNVETSISASCDSIFNLLAVEKDDNTKADHIINFYLTSIDGFPILLLDLGKRLLLLAEKKKDIMIESAGWSTLGQGQRLTGNYVKALEMHRKAVAFAEQTDNYKLMSFAVNQMGHIYKDRLENAKALSLYQTALEYAEKSKGNRLYPSMNLASIYLNLGKLDSSMYFAQSALKLSGNQSISSNHAVIVATIASIYSKQGDSTNARKYFSEAIAIAAQSRSPRYLNVSYLFVAEHFHLYKQYDSAAWYSRLAVNAVQNTSSANLALKPARMLIDYYQDKSADSTLKFWRIYSAANDSLNNTRANQQIQMLTFEEDQRKRDIATENFKYRNKVRIGLLIGGLAIFSLVAIILFYNNRQKQKSNLQLQQTLTVLQSTQKQLIQSEKMASLGELTAGIAHEIQNPLNFVNNFSEVSNELIEELKSEKLKAKSERDDKLEDELLNDISQNLEKINHHGKRADAIVKGMLQHSQSSTGKKEQTDINALCDEYLRLSYHGLRAKDKSFNVTIKTDFDASVGKININPQDIGKVVLNLLTNAFYVVNEKKTLRQAQDDTHYEPTVSIQTKKINDKVEIKVTDNGNGIPQKILDKIFQPFFTTKPTGQGTGLGLSLSYDIIKAHGGELKVETKEGEGSKFLITLPI